MKQITKKQYKDWLRVRENSKDEFGEKLCYCGHTFKCACSDPGFDLFKESVERGALNPKDIEK